MKFTIVVYAAPYSSQAAATAFNFSKTLLGEGHEIYRLFFFSDGVHNTNKTARVPQEAERHELSAVSLFESSEIAGLGQLIDAALNSDRLVNFG